MLWFWFTLAAVLLWTLGNLVDKYVGSSHLKSPLAQLVLCGFTGVVGCLMLALLFPIAMPSPYVLAVLAVTAIAYFTSSFLYFRALFAGEMSRTISLGYTMPLFVLVFAAVFLKESLSAHQYLAVPLLVFGALLLSVKKLRGLTLRKGALLAVAAAFLSAIVDTSVKALTHNMDAISIYFWLALFFGIFSLATSLVHRKEVKNAIEANPKASLGAAFSQVISIVAWLFYFTAIGFGLVSLVAAIASLQALTVFLAAVLLSFFKPELLKEVMTKEALAEKAVGVVFIVVGAVLLTI